MSNSKWAIYCAAGLFVFPFVAVGEQKSTEAEAEKHQEDPTKIATKLGLGYDDKFVVSGSLMLDAARKLNARVNEDASEWRFGGSWLFKFGIVNFNYSQSDLGGGANKRNFSVGTFVPLGKFGFAPGGWQIFPMAGYSYNEGAFLAPNPDPALSEDYVLLPGSSEGGYIGAFTFRPLSESWTALGVAGVSKGSDDYSGNWIGLGLGYTFNEHQSANIFAFNSDDDFGQQQRLRISYTHEFK